MRKTDKKIDNQIREILTDVCEAALKENTGFQWLTHLVNYSSFPKSLKVICVFDTNENLNDFSANDRHLELNDLIQKSLFDVGVSINISQVSYDTEENCSQVHNGKWTDRFAQQYH
ncbi:MAG: Fis family transcriptional regulator [Oleibacter sp.]|nr:Fis family transcriptional regulator [Thalassolituus sp.]